MRALDRWFTAATLFLLLAACTRPAPSVTPVRPEPHAASPATPTPAAPPLSVALPDAAAPSPATRVDAGAPPPPTPVDDAPGLTWTEPSVLEQLARDCRYRPAADGDEALAALRCDYDLHPQSCTADPCNDRVNTPCRTVCGATCDRCDGACRGSCDACRRGCHDDACRAACARSCGACLNTCMQTRDRCLTAECGARYAACTQRYNADFDRRCLPACRRCEASCANAEETGMCVQRCARRGGCTADQAGDCAFTGAVSHVQREVDDSGGGVPDGGT